MDVIEKELRELDSARNRKDWSNAARICNIVGDKYSRMGRHEAAMSYHREELQLCDSTGDVAGKAVAHRKVGECLAALHKFKEALTEVQKYLNLARSLKDVVEVQRAHTTEGRVWYLRYTSGSNKMEDLVRAEEAYKMAQNMCDRLDQDGHTKKRDIAEMRVGLYINLALLAEEREDYNTAIDNYNKASTLGEEAGCTGLSLKCLMGLGGLLLEKGEANRSLVVSEQSLVYAEQLRDKQTLGDCLLQLATAHLYLANFDNISKARKYLKKGLRHRYWSGKEHYLVARKYSVVSKVLVLSRELALCDNVIDSMRKYEEMGDLCCHGDLHANRELYCLGLRYYQAQLELAESHGHTLTILGSIATTLYDLDRYDQALEYYHRELTLWGDKPGEAASTWTNIARTHEAANHSDDIIVTSYNTAISLATDARAYKTLAEAYRSLLQYRHGNNIEDIDTEDKLQLLTQQHPEADVQYSTPPATPISDDEPILSSSSGDESMVEQCTGRKGVASRRRRRGINKRNEKGETPLQVAVIDGNDKLVCQLLREGAEVNSRDNSGWTPLHEACNYGHTEIASILLEHGAGVNDNGGIYHDKCNDITPLMDACINGHVDLVRLLCEYGADVTLANAEGKDALAIVNDRLAHHTSVYELTDEHREIKSILIEVMRDRGLHPIGTVEEEVQILPTQHLPSQQALINNEQWLVDDMVAPPTKRRRGTSLTSTRASLHRDVGSHGDIGNRSDIDSHGDDTCCDSYHGNDDGSSHGDIIQDRPHCISPLSDHDDLILVNEMSCDYNGVSHDHSCDVTLHRSSVIKVKVHIEGECHLIPCNNTSTIQWLVDQVSNRYFIQHGRQPSLHVVKGESLLCCSDAIIDVLEDGEQVQAVIDHWITTPLHQHYCNTCNKFNQGVHPRVLSSLQSACPSMVDVSDHGVGVAHCRALFHSLVGTLDTLILSNNRLTDGGMMYLGTLLSHTPTLTNLNISNTAITHTGLQHLVGALSDRALALRHIDLSHNNLGPTCATSLASFLALCSHTTILHLKDIGITSYSLEIALSDAITDLQKLTTLSLSQNNISNVVCPLSLTSIDLSCTNTIGFQCTTEALVELDVSGCCIPYDNKTLCGLSLATSLTHLSLSCTGATDAGLSLLARHLPSSLTRLRISGNAGVTGEGVLTLLQLHGLEHLNAAHCSIASPLPTQMWTLLRTCSLDLLDLSRNDIDSNDKLCIEGVWGDGRKLCGIIL